MKNTLTAILFLLILTSCNLKNEYSHSLKEKETWDVEIDSLTSNYSFALRLIQVNEKEYLSFYSTNRHSILIWDLQGKDIKFNSKLKNDGPNGVRRHSNYDIQNFNSIYLIPTYYKEII